MCDFSGVLIIRTGSGQNNRIHNPALYRTYFQKDQGSLIRWLLRIRCVRGKQNIYNLISSRYIHNSWTLVFKNDFDISFTQAQHIHST